MFFLFKKSIEYKNLYFILLMFFASDIQSQTINVNVGNFVELGKTDLSLTNSGTTCMTSSLCYDGYMPDILRFYTGDPSTPESCFDAARIENIDGYSGIRLSWGGLLVIYSGSISGNSFSNGNGGTGPVNLSWSNKGQVTLGGIAKAYQSSTCWYSLDYPFRGDSGKRGISTVSGSINVGLYIPKNTVSGSYVIPSYKAGRYWSNTILLAGSNDTVIVNKVSLECTVSAPPAIDFGQVPAKGDGWVPVASKDSILQINCNSDSADATATAAISFTASPLYYNRSEMLEMTTDGSSGVGILNGRYGQGNISNCSSNNSNNADAVKFDGTVSKTLDLNVGTNEVPITWTVCRRGDIQRYGDVSAQATANINWD